MPADEFETIARLFAPLATHPAARGLQDDAALLEGYPRLVITQDAIVEGVHFLADDPIETVAQKALRVNLSDLAAKGANPVGALVSLVWPKTRDAAEIAAFAGGLGADLKRYDMALLGGDTTSTPGPLTVSVTALGEPLGERTPARADARVGEDVWVTGSIGDASLGLALLTRAKEAKEAADAKALIARYRLPEPRISFAVAVAQLASASMDVSDGLAADAGKLAAASGVMLELQAEAIPISPAARRVMDDLGALLSGGDDYEILFTAPISRRVAVASAGAAAGVPVTRIGRVAAGAGARILRGDGSALVLPNGGYAHGLGR